MTGMYIMHVPCTSNHLVRLDECMINIPNGVSQGLLPAVSTLCLPRTNWCLYVYVCFFVLCIILVLNSLDLHEKNVSLCCDQRYC